MSRDQLQALSRKELAEMAHELSVEGWHGMRKEDLVEILVRRRVKAAPAKTPAKAPASLPRPGRRNPRP